MNLRFDITMCSGENCKMKEDCFRYKREPVSNGIKPQSYFDKPPFKSKDTKNQTCEFFWKIENEKK